VSTEPCNCPQALALQAELDRARVRISNLEYQNSNLRARLDAAGGGEPPADVAMMPLAEVSALLDTPAGRMAVIAELASPTPFVDADTGEAREWPPIISKETAAQLASEPLPSLGADYAAYLQAERDRPGLLRRLWWALKAAGA
jgi:hypothetical protein